MAAGVMHLPDIAARRPRFLLACFCLAMWLPGIVALPPTDRDESRFAQATKQMLETGDFVDIRNGAEARNRKPIGIHWLQVPGVALARQAGLATGNPIWPYRLPSLAGALVAVLATFAIARRMAGVRAGLLAGAMLGGSVLLATEATIAKTDAALLGATTLAVAVLARAYLGAPDLGVRVRRREAALFWLAVGVGILIKGPITPMVVGLTALTLVACDRRARWLGALRPGWGMPLMLAVVLPWFVAIGVATHGRFFADAVGGDLAGKLAGGDDAHGAPPGYHLLLLSLTLFPSGAAALCSLPSAWAGRREPATRFLLAWLVPSWVVFEAVPTKLPHYVLPVLPALCILAAAWLATPARRPPPRWLFRIAVALSVAAAVGLAAGAVAIPVALDRAVPPAEAFALPVVAVAGLVAWLLARGADRMRAAVLALALAPLLYWSVIWGELPALSALWVAPRVCGALRARGPAQGFAASGFAEPSLMFLCGTGTEFLPNGAAAAAYLAGGGGRVAAVEARTMPAFRTEAKNLGVAPRAFAEVSGFNYSNGRRVVLTLFDVPR